MYDDPSVDTGAPSLTLDDLAKRLGGRVVGSGTVEISGVCPADEAREGHIAFLASRRYAGFAADSRASAFLVPEELVSAIPPGASGVAVPDAHAALHSVLLHFVPRTPDAPSIHPTAIVGRGVGLGTKVTVEPYAVIEDGVTLGDAVRIGAHCVVGGGSRIGDRSRLHPHVVLYPGTHLGRDVIIHSGARLGSDGFGFATIEGAPVRIPHVGRCVVEDGVEVGANVTIDRGSLGDTVVGAGVKIDNLVHIAHNVRVGARSMLAALVGIAGSTRIGAGVWLGGQSGVCNQAEIGDGARVAVQTGVTRDVPAGDTVSGFPGRPHRDVLRRDALVGRLPSFVARLERVERAVGQGSG